MDVISFAEAATANGRIEITNNDPDSTSGIKTQPTNIAAGESVTIPAGRMAVLPNLQVDAGGEMTIDGEVFVPSGSVVTATEFRLQDINGVEWSLSVSTSGVLEVTEVI